MIKTLYRQIHGYWTATILTPVWTALEVLMDVLIPYVTASLIDKGINAGDMQNVYYYGTIMLGMALMSMVFGILGGRCSAYASTGFAANLRSAMYRNIQRLAFSDIDKYALSGLITRMTTDVNSLQTAFQQLLGVSVRAPFKLVLSILMCLVIDARLSLVFLVALVILSFSLYHIISRVAKLFQQVFVKYDELNQSVQENITAIRLVKAFVREDYENEKFARAADNLYKLYVKAESLMAWNHPIMNMVVYGCIIALSWLGAHYIVEGTLTTGELTSLFSYVMSILMSLMMLSMIFVMLTQSAASAKRVAEIIEEEPDIVNPEHPVMEIADGSVSFEGVRFDYVRRTPHSSLPTPHSTLHTPRQIVARQPSIAPLRCVAGRSAGRWQKREGIRSDGTEKRRERGAAEQHPLLGHDTRQSAMGKPAGHRGGLPKSLSSGLCRRIYRADARGLSHTYRTRWNQRERRTEAATLHCASPAETAPDTRARRLDIGL